MGSDAASLTVSLRFISAAIACRVASERGPGSKATAAGFPPNGLQVKASTCRKGFTHRGNGAGNDYHSRLA